MSRLDDMDRLRAEIESLRARLEETTAQLTATSAAHNGEVDALVEGHMRQTESLRSGEVRRIQEIEEMREELGAELEVETARARKLERELKQSLRRIDIIYESRTWRAGTVVAKFIGPLIRDRSKGDQAGRPNEYTTPSTSLVRSDPTYVEPPPIAHHPLSLAYQAEVDSKLEEQGVGIGFAVSTLAFDEGRGDLFVASGLGRHLRREGFSPLYLPQSRWHEMPASLGWIMAMMPAFRPSRAPFGPKIVGWVRNEIDRWLAHEELEFFDVLVCSSPLVSHELANVFSGPIEVLPIAVDTELFRPDSSDPTARVGVVSTVNQWGRERDVYKALRAKPVTFDLRLYGQMFGLPESLETFHRGPVDFFELPSIYWGAQLVLDDFNHTTVGWGAVNSRLFEALAAGALPITNSRLGLDELGLAEVPTYGNPTDLNPLVEDLLSDPDETQALVERLRGVATERHSYERRAAELADILAQVSGRAGASRVIAFAPDYRQSNPFQEMLYSEKRSHEVAAIPVNINSFVAEESLSRFQDRECLFHLHWTAPITGPAATEAEAMVRVDEILRAIDSFKDRGGRFVWTIHNVLPHETRFEELEVHLRQELANRADLIHMMCDATREEVGRIYHLPVDRTLTVTHSSYHGIYPDATDRDLARARLEIEPGDVALLALGGIRPYKGIDRLLATFDRAIRREPRLRLVIAGKPGRFEGVSDLKQACESQPGVIANFNEILPTDLQHFYKASDLAVLPHRAVLNSGALLLAYTFGLPVIAPRVGCLAELLEPTAAIAFDAESDQSLEEALVNAPSLANQEARHAAKAIADARPVREMSVAFLEALDGLFPGATRRSVG